MKKGYIKLLLICTFLILSLAVNAAFNILNVYTLIIFLTFNIFITLVLTKYEKDRFRYKKDIILTIIIYSFFYLILSYLSGLIIGFNSTGYSLKIMNILKNIVPALFTIILIEFLRYMLLVKGSTYKSILALCIIISVMLDISLSLRAFDFTLATDIVKFSVMILLPSISKNFLLTYIVYKVGYVPSIIYRLIFEISAYILPIFPAFGIYIGSVLNILFPAFLMYVIYKSYLSLERKKEDPKKSNVFKNIGIISSSILLLVIVILTCGWFKYFILTIGSGSMTPNINKGDLVVVRKLKKEELKKLKVGDVLIFKYKEITVVHRIVKIDQASRGYVFYTKGDFNEAEDNYPIEEKMVIGTTKTRVRYIGYPTVLLNELIQKQKQG